MNVNDWSLLLMFLFRFTMVVYLGDFIGIKLITHVETGMFPDVHDLKGVPSFSQVSAASTLSSVRIWYLLP